MSFWVTRRENGRQVLTLGGGGDAFLPMVLIGLVVVIAGPVGLPAALALLGFTCLLVAKVSLFRRGIWSSWGSRQMTPGHTTLYRSGYVLIGLGILLGFLLAGRGG